MYKCEASNKFGNEEKAIEVKVVPARIAPGPSAANSVTLTCTVARLGVDDFETTWQKADGSVLQRVSDFS